MLKYAWFFVLAIPPWVAVELDAPKWLIMIAVAPLFLLAMTLGDPDEELLGEAPGKFRKGALVTIGAGCIVLGSALFILWQVFF